jgi:YD repeat-containing protein
MSGGSTERLATEKTVAGTFARRMDYDVSDNLIFIGRADIASVTSAAVWQIQKLSYDVSGNPLSIIWADGNEEFDNIWDNRNSLSYS